MSQPILTALAWALLNDLTALFFGQRAVSPDKNLDYFLLADIIQKEVGSSLGPDPALCFTASADSNEKQVKFNDTLHNKLGWTVQAYPPHEAMIANPLLGETGRLIRFDARIAYCLGRLAGKPELGNVAIITDSWPLAGPVRDCVLRGTPVTVFFFGSLIDTRWHRLFREMDGKGLRFFDLDSLAERLFNRPRQPRREMLPDMP